MLARVVFGFVDFAARNGLVTAEPEPQQQAEGGAHANEAKIRARITGMRGETYAYWYLRRKGYLMVARNYTVPGLKGEIDMAGYDGRVLAFVEVKTRFMSDDARDGKIQSTPEEAVNREKRNNVARMARQFLRARRIESEPYRFDVLAIEARPGRKPNVRLHKGAYTG